MVATEATEVDKKVKEEQKEDQNLRLGLGSVQNQVREEDALTVEGAMNKASVPQVAKNASTAER